ncbi:hypothetical protein BBC0122_023430 [Bartonella choladocola]|uniref:Uncharacterized protein n=1 Tax=Bartonella choladocola TaxID=2750995 RepID=A0A1U9ML31_9HYPH|nr:hypothetical protein BBC0122_023430 [Bartonella choladocola]
MAGSKDTNETGLFAYGLIAAAPVFLFFMILAPQGG